MNHEINIIGEPCKSNKPPLGLIPADVFYRDKKIERFHDIVYTITNYMNANKSINLDWIKEYNELLQELSIYLH